MRYCTNPGCYQGDPSGPPEFASTYGTQCCACGSEIDFDDDDYAETDDGYICEDCVLYCDDCGERVMDDKGLEGAEIDGLPICLYCMATELCGGIEFNG